jgi:general secretion pathway protein G
MVRSNVSGAAAAWRRMAALVFLTLLVLSCGQESSPPPDPSAQLTAHLQTMRDGISRYAKEHGRYPNSLEEMVSGGQLREVPVDPITGLRTTWKLVREQSVGMGEFTTAAAPANAPAPIVDVRSGASGADAKGVAWSEY